MRRVLPILFNTEMIQAILDGRKTATRRAVKPTNPFRNRKGYFQGNGWWYAPYKTGDIMYARETWRVGAWDIQNQMIAFDYKDGTCGEYVYIHDKELFERLVNQSREDARKAKCKYNGDDFVWEKGKLPCRWRPSIHMPKEAARIWLKVTGVRVEKLQDITGEEVLAEGVSNQCSNLSMGRRWENQQRMEFERVWNSTIKKKDLDCYGWDANPWLWVIEFERCEKPKEG